MDMITSNFLIDNLYSSEGSGAALLDWLFPTGFWDDALTWDDAKYWGLE